MTTVTQQEPVAWISYNVLTEQERFGRMPVQSLQPGVYKHTPLYAAMPTTEALSDEQILEALSKCYTNPRAPGNSLLQRVYPGDLVKAVRALLSGSQS